MRRTYFIALLVAGLPALALGAQTVAAWNFEQGMEGWQALDNKANLSLAVGPGEAAEGTGALVLTFPRPQTAADIEARGLAGAVAVQMQPKPEPEARCLQFTVKVKLLTPLLISVSEEDGSRYQQVLTIPPLDWRAVTLYFADFNLSDDSQDENGRLDPAQITQIAFVDGAAFLVALAEQAQNQPMRMPAVQKGENEIRLDDVKLTDDETPLARAVVDASANVLRGIAVFGPETRVQRDQEGLSGMPSWRITGRLQEGEIGLLLWPLGPGVLANSPGMHIVLRSEQSVSMVMVVKERDGSEYNVFIPIAGGQTMDSQLPWPDFKLGDDSTDENGQLDVDDAVLVILGDATGILEQKPHDVDLRLAVLEAAK